jgi:hypothetical protein
MIVFKGHNNFWPLKLILPFGRKSLTYQFKIGEEWFVGEIAEPERYGCKLPAVGKFNYHNGGANWAIIHVEGKCYVYPRYYLNGLHELDHLKREIQSDIWYTVTTLFNPLAFLLDGEPIYVSDLVIPTTWITPAYLGKRRVGVAKRNLKLEIR